MSFYIDMTSVLDTFKTEIKVISNSSSGDSIDGQWVEDEEQSEQVLFEPFVPNDRDNFYSLVSMLRDTGHISQYNAIWISAHDYPIQTIVEHKNKRYRVVNIQDLTDYSNVTLYYLQSEDSNDGN